MGLLDDIHAEAPSGPDQCSVGALLERLTDADRRDLCVALDDAGVPHTAITRALNKRGHAMHAKRIALHRRGECACAR